MNSSNSKKYRHDWGSWHWQDTLVNRFGYQKGIKTCNLGMKVRFFTAANIANSLIEAQDSRALMRLEKQLSKADLLIIDELSYLTFNLHQLELLFKVIPDSAERQSVIVTTNISFSEWTTIFENKTMVERLTYMSHVLNMNSDHPYRDEHAQMKDNATSEFKHDTGMDGKLIEYHNCAKW